MGHGPGQLQRAILATVENEKVTTFESLRWKLFQERTTRLPDKGKLPTSWNTSVARSLASLKAKAKSKIMVVERYLASWEECLEHYPGKTLQKNVYLMRKELLPKIAKTEADIETRYSGASNEQYHVGRLSNNEKEALWTAWYPIEHRLMGLLAQRMGDDRDLLFRLLAKVRSVLHDDSIHANGTFSELLDACAERAMIPRDINTSMSTFREAYFPKQRAKSLKFKSLIHTLATIPTGGLCSPSLEVQNKIRLLHPEYFDEEPRGRVIMKRVLHNLLDRTAFSQFLFVTLLPT